MNLLRSFLILVLASLLLQGVALAGSDKEVRVGIFPMNPLNFVDEQGTAQGLNTDLLREMAKSDGLSLVFVPGSWGECFDRLMKGEIDLLTTVAFSPERLEIFDYNKEAVADIWGKVYTLPGAGISDIRGLHHRRVAVARKDINGINFVSTAERFDVHPRILEAESHYEIFEEIKAGEVVAGVVPQHFGFREAEKYGLVSTTIEFEPFSVFFAVKKGTNAEILTLIDRQLSKWKEEENSIYYERVSHWMGTGTHREVIPQWVLIAFGSVLLAVGLLIGISYELKRQVARRTREIEIREARFRALAENARAVPWELDLATERFTYVGPQIVDLFGYDIEEWTDMQSWVAKVHPDDKTWASEYCTVEATKGRDHAFLYRGIHKDGRTIWVHDLVTVEMGADGPKKLYGYFVDITHIREHEERFQKMFRNHGAAMLIFDPDSGVIKDANEAACEFYGYSLNEFTGLSKDEISVVPEDEVRKSRRQIVAGEQMAFETRHRLKDGRVRDVEVFSSPINIEQRPLIFSIIHDISERIEAKSALDRSEKKVRMILNSAAEAIYGVDEAGACTFCNESCIDLLGFKSESDLLGKNMHDVLHHTPAASKAYPEADCIIKRSLHFGDMLHSDEETFCRANGESFEAEFWSHPIRQEGRIVGAVVTFVDISERKRAEQALSESEKAYRVMFEEAAHGSIVTDANTGEIIACNQQLAKMVERDVSDIVGQSESVLHPLKQSEGALQAIFGHSGDKNEDDVTESRLVTRSGKIVDVEIKTSHLKLHNRDVIHGFFYDVTEKKALLAEQLRSAQLAAIGRLAANIAHEINNPTQAIISFSELIEMSADRQEFVIDMSRRITREGMKIGDLIKRTLHYSRKGEQEKKLCSLTAPVKNIQVLLGSRLLSENISLEVDFSDAMPLVVVNEQEIEQVLLNLVTNAIDALSGSDKQSGKLITIRGYVDEETPNVCLEVGDNGPGIPPDRQEKVMQAFFTTKPETEGTGLGLAISEDIITKHGGHLALDSVEGQYTRITIVLPGENLNDLP